MKSKEITLTVLEKEVSLTAIYFKTSAAFLTPIAFFDNAMKKISILQRKSSGVQHFDTVMYKLLKMHLRGRHIHLLDYLVGCLQCKRIVHRCGSFHALGKAAQLLLPIPTLHL